MNTRHTQPTTRHRSLFTIHHSLFTLILLPLLALLLAGTAQAATNDWVGTTSSNMSTAANWSPANVPGAEDVARWNAPTYPNQPIVGARARIGQLLFDSGNVNGVTISGVTGANGFGISRIEGVGLRIANGSGSVTITAPQDYREANGGLGFAQTWVNNLTSGSGVLTVSNDTVTGFLHKGLTLTGSGDTTLYCGLYANGPGPLFVMNGTGTLRLGGSVGNNVPSGNSSYVNSGTVLLDKSSGLAIPFNSPSGLYIGQENSTPALVKYNGASTDMIATMPVNIYGAGQLDFNGMSDTIGFLNIYSAGAAGDSTPITNSTPASGTLTISAVGPVVNIYPRLGYKTTLNTGSNGTLAISGHISTYHAGSGWAQISGKLDLGSAAEREFIPNNTANAVREATNDLVIDAAISGTRVGSAIFLRYFGRVVLAGSNTFSGTVGLYDNSILNIQNGNALGSTADGVNGAFAAGNYGTIELQPATGSMVVGPEPMTLNGAGGNLLKYGTVGALRNISGNTTWGGTVTLLGAARINSDGGTLTLTNTVSLATFGLTVGGRGDVTVTNGIITGTGSTLTKDGAGTLTLSGTNTFTGATTVNGGTLLLDYSTAPQDDSKLANGASLTLSKGTLTLGGGSHTEVVSATTLNAGSFAITRSGGSSTLRMNAITRNAGSTLNFAADGIADTDSVNGNGILGGYATVGGNTWAQSAASGTDLSITGLLLGSYTANAAGSLGATTANSDMSGGVDTTVATGTSINSIRFNNAAARTLTISSGTLTVTSGGILNTADVGANNNTITGGTLSSTVIHQHNTAGTLRIDSIGTGANFTKTGPGTLILGGSTANTFTTAVFVNGGELHLDKSGAVQAIPGTVPLTINQTGIVTYTGSSTDMMGTGTISINENGQLDFNGKSDTIGALTIVSTGANGDTTPIKNSGSGGNVTWGGAWYITPLTGPPMAGYRTLIGSGTGTNTLGGSVVLYAAGSGWAQISGNLSLNNASRDFSVADGDILNELVVDAAIVGGGASGALTKSGTGRLVLGGSNSYDGVTTIGGGFLQITNANALGTTVNGTTVSSGYTLELLGNIAVGNESLTLSGNGMTVGYYAVGGLRNFSGDNTWGGPVTLGAASRINSDSGTLLITNTLNLANFGLTVGSYGNVTLSGVISGTAGTLTKDGLGTLTLAGASANTFTNLTTVSDGTLVLAKTAGVAVSNLTINGIYGQYCSVRYATNSANNPMIGGTVTLTGAGQLDFNGSTDTIAVVTINSAGAVVDSQPIVNTGSGGLLTINALNITPLNEYITRLDSGTNGVLRLGGNVTFTAVTAGQGTLSGILDLGAGTRTFNVGLGTGPIYDLGISAVIANGALTKTGTGRLYLSGVNTYAGDTLVSAGTLLVTGSILNSPTVTVGQNATLQTDSANALGANATLALVSDGQNANYGKANLNFVGTQTVAVLRFDGVAQGGTWGSTSSTAANKTNTWFSGTGVVLVNGPQIQNEIVTNVTDTGATFNGWLVSGGPATVGVLWGTTDGGISGDWAYTNWFDSPVTDNTHLSTNISPLTTGIPYYYTFVASNASGVVRAGPSVAFVPQAGTTRIWMTTNTTDWATPGNWSPAGVPDENCNVIINTAGGKQPLVNLSGSVTIRSLSIGATAASTLTITNGNVDTKILIVTNDVTIGPNGTLTHVADWSTGTTVGSESNRLCLVVSNNLTIAAGGQINVNLKGYQNAGPGKPGGSIDTAHGAGHGGEGGTYSASSGSGGTTYGSITNPINSGTGQSGRGGGVVVVRVTGTMTHNGAITAQGGPGTGSNAGGNSGGSINLTVSSITGPGALSVVGGESSGVSGRGTGGGGRIAVKVTGGGTVPDSILANITAGVAGNYTTVSRGAAGTIYIQDATRTNLIVDQQNMTNSARGACTLLHDVTNGFSNVIVTNGALLAVGTNAQLNLDGCTLLTPPSTMATTNITSRLIIKDNGMLNWTGTWTNNGCISWYSNNYARMWNGSLVVASNAILTHEAGETHAIRLNLGGDLTLATNAAIWVQGMGYQNRTGIGLGDGNGSGSHGGEGGLGASSTYRSRTYGSVTNPITPGSCGSYAVNGGNPPNGGGVVIVRAAGAASVYGTIDASSGTMLDRPGSGGGSVNILAAALAGTGQIVAKGGDTTATAGGGGGRIAVVLTNSATFGNVLMSAVGGSKGSVYGEGGAGTIYLKTINQPYGLLIVSNCYATANGTTLISTQVTDAVVGDVQILGTGTKLVVSNTCTLTVYGSWSNAVATNAISGGTVVLAGASPATVWGGNTWSNLTITTAGKVVSFEHSKTQTVYGIPAFSNVTLRSTLDNTQWHLRKSGNGYQDVGVVTVYDSNAGTDGTHLTFRGAVGSVVSDPQNVNWDAFKAKGTLIMMR